LVLPFCERADAAKVAESVRRDARAVALTTGEMKVGGLELSIGIASFPADAQTAAEVLCQADFALLRDKGARRQRSRIDFQRVAADAPGGGAGGAA
jgi:GGDEF domain-containing protein